MQKEDEPRTESRKDEYSTVDALATTTNDMK